MGGEATEEDVKLSARRKRVGIDSADEDGEGNGEFSEDDAGEADLAWIAYLVAEK